VFYDTLIVEKNKTKHSKSKSKWSLSPTIGLFSSMPNHKESSNASSEYVSLTDNATSKSLSYSFGAQAHYDVNDWRVTTGLAYTSIYEEFNYQTEKLEAIPVVKFTLSENGFYTDVVENVYIKVYAKDKLKIDTVQTWYTVHEIEYDTYIVIDTVWRYDFDTIIIHGFDTLKTYTYDSVRVATYDTSYYNGVDTNVYSTFYQNVNKYTYLEVPLSIGYGFRFKRFTLRPTVGAVFGVMLNAKGKGISLNNKNEVYNLSNSELPFMNLQITAYLGLGLEYRIHNGVDIFIQPFYRRSLTSLYQNSAIIEKRFTGIGANFGLTYHF
jgi:hypothetical protein